MINDLRLNDKWFKINENWTPEHPHFTNTIWVLFKKTNKKIYETLFADSSNLN